MKLFLSVILLSIPLKGLADILTNVSAIAQNPAAGASTLYTFRFTTSASGSSDGTVSGIPKDGKIEITFPASFDLSNVISASSGDPTVMNGGFSAITVAIGVVTCIRDGTGNDVAKNADVVLNLAMIGNPSSPAQNLRLEIRTLTNTGNLIDFYLTLFVDIIGPIANFTLSLPGTAIKAGQAFSLSVSKAKDADSLYASGVVTIDAFTGGGAAPDGTTPVFNDIVVVNGVGSAMQTLYKAEQDVRLRGTSGAGAAIPAVKITSAFTVQHAGSVSRIGISGEPSTTQSGNTFTNPIIVTAHDAYKNIVLSYKDSVHFVSSDTLAQLPADYKFEDRIDQGVHSFPGSSFILRTAGPQTIWVVDQSSRSDTTQAIQVDKGPIDTFDIVIGASPKVNQSVAVTISNARDAAGNLTNGTVTLAFADGQAHAAPDGTLPVLTDINVVNGAGSSNIRLYKAEKSVVLRGTSGSVNQLSSAFAVAPGSLYEFELSGYPASVLAGQDFSPDSVRVVAKDAFANLKTDYADSVWFTSSDTAAVFTYYERKHSYRFQPVDSGVHWFRGNEFILKTTGQQTFAVTDSIVTKASNSIVVSAGNIASFDLSARTLTPAAGDTFSIFVSNARDGNGNPTSGLIALSFKDGDTHTAPDGHTQPTLNHIEVVNGYGKAKQRLFRAESGLSLKAESGAAMDFVIVNVLPGAFAAIDVSAPPDTVTAGLAFSSPITVTMLDAWRNIKTDFAGPLYFSTSSALFQLTYNSTNPFQFNGSENGTHTFAGSDFRLRTAGSQTITAVSGSVTQRSSSILVKSAAIASFQLQVGSTQTAGMQFPLQAANVKDSYNNPASGTITITAASGGNPAPNGVPPTLNNISVVNGSGTAYQTLVKRESVTLRGSASGINVNTPTITVLAAALAQFDMAGLPTSAVSGVAFPSPVVVTAKDAFGNEKTDYSGTLRFTSIDASASLPPDTTVAARSQVSYSGSRFTLRTGGSQTITVRDVTSGVSKTSNAIEVSAIVISQVSSSIANVSRRQTNAVVSMAVQNIGNQTLTNVEAQLHFRQNSLNLDSKFIVTRTDGITNITPGSPTVNLTFNVQVLPDADLGTVTIDGSVTAMIGSQLVSDASATITDTWTVQEKAELTFDGFNVPANIDQGQTGTVTTTLSNNYGYPPLASADAVLAANEFIFTSTQGDNYSSYFSVTAAPSNPATITGGARSSLQYYITAANNAPLETILIRQRITYHDGNIGQETTIESAVANFECRERPAMVLTEITPSQSTVTQGQDSTWTVRMGVRNSGGSPMAVSFEPSKTYIRFRFGSNDYTSTYTIQAPTTFSDGSTNINAGETKYINFVINKVGNATGSVYIFGRVETTGGLFTTSEASNIQSGIEVQTPDNLVIQKILPSQPTATVGDTSYHWQVAVALRNNGGSEVQIDFNQSGLLLDHPLGFLIEKPTQLKHLGSSLKAGQADTLVFTVKHTGTTTGQNAVDATIHYVVFNTTQSKNITASSGVKGSVVLQNPSNFRITSVRASRETVTAGVVPNWWVAVNVSNEGGGADVEVDLTSPNTWVKLYRTVPQPGFAFRLPTAFAGSGAATLAAGARDSLIFSATAMGSTLGRLGVFSGIRVIELNRNKIFEQISEQSESDSLTVQTRANISYSSGSLNPRSVSPQQFVTFRIDLNNAGQSTLELAADSTKFEFTDGIRNFSTSLDPALGTAVPGNGTATLYFRAKDIPSNFSTGNFVPKAIINGLENGNLYGIELTLTSDLVTVGTPGELAINYLTPDVPAITAPQTKPWNINIGLTNNGTSSLRLDSAKVTFLSNTVDVSDMFSIVIPDTLTNGSRYLRSYSSSVLRVQVNAVDATVPYGQVSIQGSIFTTDSTQTSRHPDGQTSASLPVQSPAQLRAVKLQPSQLSVTRGQDAPWHVAVHLRNFGGSTVRLATEPSQTLLRFDKGNEHFQVVQPTALEGSGGLDLLPNITDSLIFTIQTVDTLLTAGQCTISPQITATEINSDRVLTETSGSSPIVIHDPARIRIDGFEVDVPYDTSANTNQQFYIRALVTNTGSGSQEQVQQATVRIYSPQGLSTFPNGFTALIDTIGANQSKWMRQGVLVKAHTDPVIETFYAQIADSRSKNTGKPVKILRALQASDTTKTVRIQRPGELVIKEVTTSLEGTIPTGSVTDWFIYVVVTNTGEGILEIEKPDSTNISASKPGFVFKAPTLTGADFLLMAGETDTLIYTVDITGPEGGAVTLTAKVNVKDGNSGLRIFQTKPVQITVATNAAVRIAQTFVNPDSFYVDADSVAHVNTGQDFTVSVRIKNEGGQDLRNVRFRLNAPSSTFPGSSEAVIENLELGKYSNPPTLFRLRAHDAENLQGEIITTQILEAIGEDGSSALRRRALDSTATITIYNPASLQIVGTTNLALNATKHVSFGQSYSVAVDVANFGSEAARDVKVSLDANPDSLGRIEQTVLSIPGTIAKDDTKRVVFKVTSGMTAQTVGFKSAIDRAIGINSNKQAATRLAGGLDSTYAILEPGAALRIVDVAVSALNMEVKAGSREPWYINVVVENTGAADLEFTGIAADNITFTNVSTQTIDENYKLRKPDGLEIASSMILHGGLVDTLSYIVTQTGDLAGQTEIKVRLKAYDMNKGPQSPELTAEEFNTILVISSAFVNVKSTNVGSLLLDKDGNGLVNRGQSFKIAVVLQTGQIEGVDSVKVVLRSNGGTIKDSLLATVPNIPKDTHPTVAFPLIADDTWSESLKEKKETFFAEILSAKAVGDTVPAQVRKPDDSLAVVRIQNPAKLELSLLLKSEPDSILTSGQEFTVLARVKNLGSAQVEGGVVSLTPPTGYHVLADTGWTTGAVDKPFALADQEEFRDIQYQLMAPSENSIADAIKGEIKTAPKDRNSGETALTPVRSDTLYVTTLTSQVSVRSFVIVKPTGAQDGIISAGQDITLQARIEATQNLRNRRVWLEVDVLPGEAKYVFKDTPQQVMIVNAPDTVVEWTLLAPNFIIPDRHNFTVYAEGTSDEGLKTDSSQITINQIVRRASLALQELKVSFPPGVMQNQVAVFSLGQTAILRTRVANDGDADVTGVGKVRIDFLQSGLIMAPDGGTQEKEFKIDSDVEWKVVAPNVPVNPETPIRVSISQPPKDENSDGTAEVGKGKQELPTRTEAKGFIDVTKIELSSPAGARDGTLSTEQEFDVSAQVSYSRVRSDMLAEIHSSTNEFIITEPQIRVSDTQTTITWRNIKAPRVERTVADTLWVTVSGNDQSSGDPINAQSNKMPVWTQQKTVFSLNPRISIPAGLGSNVSTGQMFELSAQIIHEGAPYVKADSFGVQLIHAAGYNLLSNSVQTTKSVAVAPTWQLQAPEEAPLELSKFTFTFVYVPHDSNSGQSAEKKNTEFIFNLQTVERTQVRMNAFLDEEGQISSGSVRIGSQFRVTAALQNLGEAGWEGKYRVQMRLPDPAYTTEDSLVKTGVSSSIYWTVTAPKTYVPGRQDTIFLKLLKAPQDIYAKTDAVVLDSTAQVLVSPEAGMLLARTYSVRNGSAILKGGTNIPMLGVELRNKDFASGTESVLKGLKLSLRTKNGEGVSASLVLARLAAVRHSDYGRVLAQTNEFGTSNQVYLDFAAQAQDTFTVVGSRPDSFDVVVDIASSIRQLEFLVSIDSSSHFIASDALSGQPLVVSDSTGQNVGPLSFVSSNSVLIEEDLKESFCNYPNPFGKAAPYDLTWFLYYLKQPSDVEIRIFTLTGDLVRAWSYNKASHPLQTSQGLHEKQIWWDGMNGRGVRVMNGVYLAYITTEYGETGMTKIAVVK